MSVTANTSGLQRQPLQLSRGRLLGGLMLLAAALLALTAASWHYHQQTLARLQQQSEWQQRAFARQLAQARRLAAGQLNRLAGEVGELQARLDRLNAASSLLASRLELDQTQWADVSLAVGGPQPAPAVQASLSHLLLQVEQMSEQLTGQQSRLDLLESVAFNQHIASQGQISGAPVVASETWQSSAYGLRQDPFTQQVVMHHGIDFAGKAGTQIIATGAGVVSWAGERPGYGMLVEITHADGLVTRYAHAASVLVKAGEVVSKGQAVALIGNSGRSTGPHVHYEVVKRGRPLNPGAFVYHHRD